MLPLRDLAAINYLPMLSVRWAEMRALQELPARDKDEMFPLLQLRPWASAHRLDSALSRIEEAYGDRPFLAEVCADEVEGPRRPVHDELDRLRDPANGYGNWVQYLRGQPNFVPVVQLGDLRELPVQIDRLYQLGRGVGVRFPRGSFPSIEIIARQIAALTDGGNGVCFIVDFEKQNADLLTRQMECTGYVRAIIAQAPRSFVSVSASSFPEQFGGLVQQEIYERFLFDGVRPHVAAGRLIYSDRGSARVERRGGGGGLPAARIDYAEPQRWRFYRADSSEDRTEAYRVQAQSLVGSDDWDHHLRLWGTQMIARTAMGDLDAITSPARSTAARINIHLHQQLFYGGRDGLYDTDEPWSD